MFSGWRGENRVVLSGKGNNAGADMISRGASQNARETDALCRPRLHGHGACAEALGALSYQPLLALTTRTTSNMTGTSISTPTTVARAAPDSKPNRLIAAATASSKKFEAPIRPAGQATLCFSPKARFRR